jgi:23S rRNA pseudouridine1911/1915/1917 synthase
MRLDVFLSTQLRATSRTRARAIAQSSAYSDSGKKLRPSERLRPEQRIALWRPALDEEPPPQSLREIYQDPHLLAFDKPPLMTVHPTARHHRYTVIKQLEESRPTEYLSLIHRLDRETSGVLLVARSKQADRAFKMKLEERSHAEALAATRGAPISQADKIYLAITWGVPPDGIVDAALEADPSPLRVKMRVTDSGGLAARTRFTVLRKAADYALVRCELFTGRQHQIRVHLAHLGTPVVGDKLYGPDESLLARGADGQLTQEDLDLLELPRHALHAYQYRLPHAITGEPLAITANLPADLTAFFQSKGGEVPGELLT